MQQRRKEESDERGVGIGSVVAGLFLLTPAQTSAPRLEQNQNDVLAAGLVGTWSRHSQAPLPEAAFAIVISLTRSSLTVASVRISPAAGN
jgi:hypothetical protein